jgi:hypothetical protein
MWAEALILKECHTIQGIKSKNKMPFSIYHLQNVGS